MFGYVITTLLDFCAKVSEIFLGNFLNMTQAKLKQRFRGFLPVVVDVETAGFNAQTDALLEVAAIPVLLNDEGQFICGELLHEHVEPFPGANLDPKALEFTGIIPDHPLRFAKPELAALDALFSPIEKLLKETGCSRAVLVGHNAWFDLSFIKAASDRCKRKLPFHSFTSFDTATLAGIGLGQTVLARACQAARIPFDTEQAHSAIYDTERTAELFCYLANRMRVDG